MKFLPLCLLLGCLAGTLASSSPSSVQPAIILSPTRSKTKTATTKKNENNAPKPIRGGSMVTATAVPTLMGPVHAFLTALAELKSHLAAAAVARSSSLLACYPIDTVKTRIQTANPNPFGMQGLYGGIGSCLLGQIPYAVLTFGSYEQYKRKIRERFPNLKPIFAYAVAAILGDVTGSGWLCPAEVVKQKLQAGMYESAGQAFSGTYRKEGVRGFYRGYVGGLARDVPYRVAQMTTYEVAKSLYIRFKKSRRNRYQFWSYDSSSLELSPAESAILGGIAGCISCLITQPMDVLRTQMMTNSAAYGNSMVTCLQSMFHQRGIRGIYTGLIPRLAYVAPSVAIFFISYELTQQKLKDWE